MSHRPGFASLLLALPLLAGGTAGEHPRADGGSAPRFSRDGWIEYVPGDAPLILLVPHGGTMRPREVRDRPAGVRLSDGGTLELARELARRFGLETGLRPHLVICHLHRTKLDANRAEAEAAQGDPRARAAWRAWHAFVEQARHAVVRRHGAGLLIDVHGHSHPEGWIEWGYGLSAGELAREHRERDADAPRRPSSIDGLALRTGTDRALLLSGPESLGALTRAAGYESVPGPGRPHPGEGSYFDGGYNTRRHGSMRGGGIDAVQLEVPRHLRSDAESRRRFARDLARCLASFLERWYCFRRAPEVRQSARGD